MSSTGSLIGLGSSLISTSVLETTLSTLMHQLERQAADIAFLKGQLSDNTARTTATRLDAIEKRLSIIERNTNVNVDVSTPDQAR
jgi:hypothetical protein